jgi:hypothetical protein
MAGGPAAANGDNTGDRSSTSGCHRSTNLASGDCHRPSPHRVHAYGAGVSSVVYGNHEVDPDLRAVNLAIRIIEQFAGRIPWTERLELQAVKPTSDQMADLMA